MNTKEYIQKSTREYCDHIRDMGGYEQFLLAVGAQLLLLTVWYLIGKLLMPIEDSLLENGVILALAPLVGSSLLYVLRRAPSWISELLVTGEGFFVLDKKALKYWIIGLSFVTLFLTVLIQCAPLKLCKNNQ